MPRPRRWPPSRQHPLEPPACRGWHSQRPSARCKPGKGPRDARRRLTRNHCAPPLRRLRIHRRHNRQGARHSTHLPHEMHSQSTPRGETRQGTKAGHDNGEPPPRRRPARPPRLRPATNPALGRPPRVRDRRLRQPRSSPSPGTFRARCVTEQLEERFGPTETRPQQKPAPVWSGNRPLVPSQQRAPEGIRTPNLLIRSQMLYPLSYGRPSRERDLPSVAAAPGPRRIPSNHTNTQPGAHVRQGTAPFTYERGARHDRAGDCVLVWRQAARGGRRAARRPRRESRGLRVVRGAEAGGFEPPRGFETPTRLAGGRHRPD